MDFTHKAKPLSLNSNTYLIREIHKNELTHFSSCYYFDKNDKYHFHKLFFPYLWQGSIYIRAGFDTFLYIYSIVRFDTAIILPQYHGRRLSDTSTRVHRKVYQQRQTSATLRRPMCANEENTGKRERRHQKELGGI